MQDLEFSEVVELICKEDNRFDRRAYTFIRHALDSTVKGLKKKQPDRTSRSQHVTGAELLEGIRTYAIEQYGPLAKTVLNAWGITRCRDFGDIVFNLIEYNVFSKTENDRREDFADIYEFDEAFVKPFEPVHKSRRSWIGAPSSNGPEAADSTGPDLPSANGPTELGKA